MYYTLGFVKYVFPYQIQELITEPELLGVLLPYLGKKMTEREADILLAEIILKHPTIEGAMLVEINVDWHDENYSGIYQILTINNPDHYKHEGHYTPTPIKWRDLSKED